MENRTYKKVGAGFIFIHRRRLWNEAYIAQKNMIVILRTNTEKDRDPWIKKNLSVCTQKSTWKEEKEIGEWNKEGERRGFDLSG